MTNDTLTWVFTLLIIFQIKHFLADFVFQNVYMLQKSNKGWSFALPLAVHSGIHGLLCLPIVLYVNSSLWYLAVFDFAVHFVVDRIKSGPRFLGRFNDHRTQVYWILFGADQMVHHLTHLLICWILVTH